MLQEADEMDSQEFTLTCIGLGLDVTKTGLIKDDNYDYGVVNSRYVQAMDGSLRALDLNGITELKYNESQHTLALTYADGTISTIEGARGLREDIPSIVRMSAMPTCLMELNSVIDVLFPGIDEKLYFDVLNEQIAFDPTLFNLPPTQSGRPLLFGDEYVPMYLLQLQTRLRDQGFTGRRYPSKEVCLDTLKYRAFRNPRNLFREWLESLTWDGKPRLRRWFMDGLGATAPPLEEGGCDKLYLESATEAWFLGTVRRQYEPTKVEVVPVFIGGEGIGKGNFLRYTAGYNDAWFIDTSASLEGQGAEQKFLESIRGRVIVELSESTQFSTVKGAELLKSFVSKTEDQCRKAYAAFQTTSIRRFTLVATSNQNNIFLDTGGGNRRYFPMYCDPNRAILPFDPKYRQIGRYAMEQVWAEAMHLFRTDPHADAFISKEVAELAAVMQEYGTRENPAISLIDDWLNDPLNGYAEIGSRITKQLIFRKILHVDPDSLIPRSAEYAYNTWTSIQKCWRKHRKTARVEGTPSNAVYERIHTPDEIMEKRRSNMVNVRPDELDTFIDVVGIMRSRAFKYGYKKPGDEFPIDDLSDEILDALLTSGYIYERDNSKYYLATLP